MAVQQDAPAIPERATQAQTRAVTVRLSDFLLKPELYSHRDPEDLSDRERLKPLMDSLVTEGLQNPVEFSRDAKGRPVPTKGHRRISAMRQLAKENTPGFTEDMMVPAVEVLDATPQDLLCRSVSDNVVRKNLTMGERIRAAKTLHEGGVEASRAAFALGYSTKQYLRDLRLAQQDWMLGHVEADSVGHTAAGSLLEAAEKAGRVDDLRRHVDAWVAARKEELAATGKDKKVSSLLTKGLSDHWAELLREGKPLDDKVAPPAAFEVSIDPDASRIVVDGTVDLMKTPLATLERFELSLLQLQEVVSDYRAARSAVEGPRGPQDVARKAAEELSRLTTMAGGEPSDAEDGAEDGAA
jgi:ParB-like chromosome segregation protein Spo0J